MTISIMLEKKEVTTISQATYTPLGILELALTAINIITILIILAIIIGWLYNNHE